MIEEINEDILFTELDKKQDVMLNTKQGFFSLYIYKIKWPLVFFRIKTITTLIGVSYEIFN